MKITRIGQEQPDLPMEVPVDPLAVQVQQWHQEFQQAMAEATYQYAPHETISKKDHNRIWNSKPQPLTAQDTVQRAYLHLVCDPYRKSPITRTELIRAATELAEMDSHWSKANSEYRRVMPVKAGFNLKKVLAQAAPGQPGDTNLVITEHAPGEWSIQAGEVDHAVRLEGEEYVVDSFRSADKNSETAYIGSEPCSTWDEVLEWCREDRPPGSPISETAAQ